MTEELHAHFKEHQDILRRAVNRTGFRSTMPERGQEAIDAGLVEESDPTWMYSDDHRAQNGFALTELGRQVARAQGWICACAGHRAVARTRNVHVTPAIDGMCANCRGQPQAVRAGRARWAGVLPDVPEEPGKTPRETGPGVPSRPKQVKAGSGNG